MPDLEVEVIVRWGTKNVSVRHEVTSVVGDGGYTIARNLIRDAADGAARAFPTPRSPYSDDLFKVAPNPQLGIVDAPAPDRTYTHTLNDDAA